VGYLGDGEGVWVRKEALRWLGWLVFALSIGFKGDYLIFNVSIQFVGRGGRGWVVREGTAGLYVKKY
jgi:ABC-type uncharacterized transport system permease subunit